MSRRYAATIQRSIWRQFIKLKKAVLHGLESPAQGPPWFFAMSFWTEFHFSRMPVPEVISQSEEFFNRSPKTAAAQDCPQPDSTDHAPQPKSPELAQGSQRSKSNARNQVPLSQGNSF